MPVLINALGSHARMKAALGVSDYESIQRRIESFIKPEIPGNLWQKIQMLPKLAELNNFIPCPFKGRNAAVSGGYPHGPECADARSPADSEMLGRTMVGRSLPWAPCLLRTRPRVSGMSGCIACKSTTTRPPACTGKNIMTGHGCTKTPDAWGSKSSMWRSRLAVRRMSSIAPRLRCPPASTR